MQKQYTQIPREVQVWQHDDYVSTIWWHAVNTFGLRGNDAAEYVRIEQELDRIYADPARFEAHNERYQALLRRHTELTTRRPLSIAA